MTTTMMEWMICNNPFFPFLISLLQFSVWFFVVVSLNSFDVILNNCFFFLSYSIEALLSFLSFEINIFRMCRRSSDLLCLVRFDRFVWSQLRLLRSLLFYIYLSIYITISLSLSPSLPIYISLSLSRHCIQSLRRSIRGYRIWYVLIDVKIILDTFNAQISIRIFDVLQLNFTSADIEQSFGVDVVETMIIFTYNSNTYPFLTHSNCKCYEWMRDLADYLAITNEIKLFSDANKNLSSNSKYSRGKKENQNQMKTKNRREQLY